jgi:arylsulfatase A-like enzyme
MSVRWLPLVLVGALLGSAEAALVYARAFDLFLSSGERALYGGALAAVHSVVVVLLGALIAPALAPRAQGARAGVALGACALGGWLGVLLSEGRRVRDLAYRPAAVLVFALAVGLAAYLLLVLVARVRGHTRRAPRSVLAGALGLCALLVLIADVQVLPRGYPPFHAGCYGLTLLLVTLAGSLFRLTAPRRLRPLPTLGALGVLGALGLARIGDHPNVGFIAREHGPYARKLLGLLPARAPADRVPVPAPSAVLSAATPLDLRDRDVLLVTVDALRADMLRAYGGAGVAPNMDALADEGVVFTRAYTPAPHTSYALASLLTAKFLKPVAELSPEPRDHVTLPDLLRRYGYRTAAFYPPAIFFVDGARFQPLHGRAFGFEYLKEMYAPAMDRVQQLRDYLAAAQPGHPLFVWVHLFEPHEPYEPSPSWTRRDSARARYEGEVADADRAFGELVRTFRAAKPNGTVILTADHGEEFGEHGGAFHGSTLYDEQVRIPLVWSSPGLTPRTSGVPVELVDVGTTVLATAFVPRDPRMRGDDLSPALRGDAATEPRNAFASVDSRSMVTDGRLKAVCAAGEPHCQLFDLAADPREQRSLTATRGEDAARLRGVLEDFLRSIPAQEALSVERGVAFPEALARAELGAPDALPELVGLLDDPRASVRAKAARVLGARHYAVASARLEALRREDVSPEVRAESAIAALALGEGAARDDVRELLASSDADRAVRAALALGAVADPAAVPQLNSLAADGAASESLRLLAVHSLGRIPGETSQLALASLLGEPRLGAAAAEALTSGGFAGARDALAAALATQRYPSARAAQAAALFHFDDPRALPLTRMFLGMETSLPGGLALLEEHGAFRPARADGGPLIRSALRRGRFDCDARGCAPGERAELLVKLPEGPHVASRLVVLVEGEAGAVLDLAGARHTLHGGREQLSVRLGPGGRALPVSATGEVRLRAVLVVPAREELPPPAAEPWDGGTE